MSHETFKRDQTIQGSSNRALGLTFGAVFLIVGLYPLAFSSPARLWSLGIASVFALVALALPSLLGPLNKAWTAFGLLLHKVTSPIVLGIMFFGVVTPTALLMRALGKDVLKLRRDPAVPSYWVDRQPPGPKPDSLPNQF